MTATRGNDAWKIDPSIGRLPRLPVAAMVAAMVVLLAGCGGINTQTLGEEELAFFVHGPQIPSGGNAAEVVGTLTTGGGCVLLDQDGNRFPVVWPSGTSVETTNPLVIELPSGEQLREGDQVSGGGGYPYAETLDIEVPEACLNEWGEVAVFNPDDDPVVASSGVSPVSAPRLRCDEDLVESAIYDYGETPPPDGSEPLEAVEAFFGPGVPQEADLEVHGLEVHILQDDRTVAIIGLLSVPDGYVVESFDACEGVIRG